MNACPGTAVVVALALIMGAPAAPAAPAAAPAAAPDRPAASRDGALVAAADAAIVAPGTVDPGQTVNVVVDGAVEGARIELWGPVMQTGGAARISDSPLVGGTARLVAPTLSASYELRYVGPGGAVLARAPFDVAAVPVALSVPTPVGAGGALRVTWQGPASPGDRFEIVGPSGAVLAATPVAGSAATANVSTLTVPDQRGTLELRYVTGHGAVLRSVRFDVR